jgi:hypothetical protein
MSVDIYVKPILDFLMGTGLDQSDLAYTHVRLIVWYHSFVLEDNNAAFRFG